MDIDIVDIEQAIVNRALVLQHDMSGHLSSADFPSMTGSTAFMQGAADLGESTQRTLTSASATDGATAWSMTTNAIISQASLYLRRFITVLSYHTRHVNRSTEWRIRWRRKE